MVSEPVNAQFGKFVVARAKQLLFEGQRNLAKQMLKEAISNMPADWQPVMETPESVNIYLWEMEEYLSYVAYVNEQQGPNPLSDKPINKPRLWSIPSYSEAYYTLAFMAVEDKDWDLGLEYINKALELEKDHPLILCEKALILNEMGEHDLSYEMFLEASLCRPWAPLKWRTKALRGAGIALIEMNKLDDAEKLFNISLQLEPENETAINELQYIGMLRAGATKCPRRLKPSP